ncbi:hypothetical protein PR048_011249 [Dryococelus australis]|uniref:Uncharacterized protein n=1 Tax=Dryococelus australis TaxID=614101 RepID=A0ABQ9HMD8_9NEOP|nr:hypothetical protein PR048_011249 [Dryococelus australis]
MVYLVGVRVSPLVALSLLWYCDSNGRRKRKCGSSVPKPLTSHYAEPWSIPGKFIPVYDTAGWLRSLASLQAPLLQDKIRSFAVRRATQSFNRVMWSETRMGQHRIASGKGVLRENPQARGNVRHVTHVRKPRDPTGNLTRLTLGGSELSCHYITVPPRMQDCLGGRRNCECQHGSVSLQETTRHDVLLDLAAAIDAAPTSSEAEFQCGVPAYNRVVRLLTSHPGEPVRFPGRSLPDFRMWESCRTTPLVGGFSRGSPVSPALAFRRCSILNSLHPHRISMQKSLFSTKEDEVRLDGSGERCSEIITGEGKGNSRENPSTVAVSLHSPHEDQPSGNVPSDVRGGMAVTKQLSRQCIHFPDWPRKVFTLVMAPKVEVCRRTMVVVTPHILTFTWCSVSATQTPSVVLPAFKSEVC